MKTTDMVLAQLIAIRAQVDAAIAVVSGTAEDPGCTHPREGRENLSTMGGPETYLCRACGETITEDEDD